MLAGLMQQVPLTLNMVRERVAALYSDKTVVTRYPSGLVRASYGEVLSRAARVANFLTQQGARRGSRVASLAWNSQRHLELYLAVPCMGSVLHTINARLAASDIEKLLLHANDEVLFVDHSLWRALAPDLALPSCVRHVVVMEDEAIAETLIKPSSGAELLFYEEAVADYSADFNWPLLKEEEAAGLCYTSGTTGDPKGVLYSHRLTTLHTFACLFADGIGMRERDVCMPAVPMFHANAWGFPYAALMAGASLALPCRQTDPVSLIELTEAANVTMATAVPTVWLGFLDHLRSHSDSFARIKSLKRLPIGGAAVGQSLIDGFAERGIEVMHCWGMTEISPLGLTNVTRSDLDPEQEQALRTAQGIPIAGCVMRLVDADGNICPHDGRHSGELQVSSPWAAAAYFGGSGECRALRSTSSFTEDDGREWLRTGDIATIDHHGYVRIVDRAKDLIKSGGEWISSQALELQLMNHPEIKEAAAISRPDPKWQERPVACVVLHNDSTENRARLEQHLPSFLSSFFPRWQIPEDISFWDELPKGRTGKIDKISLRKQVQDRYSQSETDMVIPKNGVRWLIDK